MMPGMETDEREVAREAIEDLIPLVTRLLRSLTRPEAPAVGAWSAIETAVHLSHVWDVDHKIIALQGDDLLRQIGLLGDGTFTIPRVSELTQEWVNEDEERDPVALAQRVELLGAELGDSLRRGAKDYDVTWLGGAQIPASGVAWHCVEETLVHGWDIARSQRLPWAIAPGYAAATLFRFAVPLLQAVPTTFFRARAAVGFRGTVGIRLRGHGDSAYLTVYDCDLRVETTAPSRVDAYISADPEAYLLLQMGRLGPLRAALRGKMAVWGRRPWYAQKIRSLVRHP